MGPKRNWHGHFPCLVLMLYTVLLPLLLLLDLTHSWSRSPLALARHCAPVMCRLGSLPLLLLLLLYSAHSWSKSCPG